MSLFTITTAATTCFCETYEEATATGRALRGTVRRSTPEEVEAYERAMDDAYMAEGEDYGCTEEAIERRAADWAAWEDMNDPTA